MQGGGLKVSGVGERGIVIEDFVFFVEPEVAVEAGRQVILFCGGQRHSEALDGAVFSGVIAGGNVDGLIKPRQHYGGTVLGLGGKEKRQG